MPSGIQTVPNLSYTGLLYDPYSEFKTQLNKGTFYLLPLHPPIDRGIEDLATASERQQGSGQTTATRTILSKGYYIDHLRIIDLHIYFSSRLAGEPPTTMDRLYDNNESKSKCGGAEQTKENNNEGPLTKDVDPSSRNKTSKFGSYAL